MAAIIHRLGWRLGLALLSLLLCTQGLGLPLVRAEPPAFIWARVATVHSGQAMEVLAADSTQTTAVRLLGIDAPDRRQLPWGETATQALRTQVAGQQVRLEFDQERTDEYGRTLAYVWLDGRLINERLVADGRVLASGRSPNTRYERRLSQAQETARLLQRGIWHPAAPMRQLPREFRRELD